MLRENLLNLDKYMRWQFKLELKKHLIKTLVVVEDHFNIYVRHSKYKLLIDKPYKAEEYGTTDKEHILRFNSNWMR